jgi:hypothetical protein
MTLAPGQAVTFRVSAAGGDHLAYVWMVDGRPVGDGPQWRMVAHAAPKLPVQTVEVEVSDASGSARQAWTVEVAAPHAAKPPKHRRR